MASVESTARKLSGLSVSKPPSSSLVDRLGPFDIFATFPGSSTSFPAGRRGEDSKVHDHVVIVIGQTFTVDGGEVRYADDPNNQSFLESIKNYQLPEEFLEEGMHMIRVATVLPPELITIDAEEDERDAEFHRLMKSGTVCCT